MKSPSMEKFVPSADELTLASQLLHMTAGSWSRTSDCLSADTALGILKQSGISYKQIREIWSIADRDGSGQLTKEELTVVIRLAGWVQAGENFRKSLLEKEGPLPKIKGIPHAAAPHFVHSLPPITSDVLESLNEMFLECIPVNGALQKREVMAAYMHSKPDLSFDALFRVMELIDCKNGLCDFKRFATGLHIIRNLDNSMICSSSLSVLAEDCKLQDHVLVASTAHDPTQESPLSTKRSEMLNDQSPLESNVKSQINLTHPPSHSPSLTTSHADFLAIFKEEVARLTSQLETVVQDQARRQNELNDQMVTLTQENIRLKQEQQMLQAQLANKEKDYQSMVETVKGQITTLQSTVTMISLIHESHNPEDLKLPKSTAHESKIPTTNRIRSSIKHPQAVPATRTNRFVPQSNKNGQILHSDHTTSKSLVTDISTPLQNLQVVNTEMGTSNNDEDTCALTLTFGYSTRRQHLQSSPGAMTDLHYFSQNGPKTGIKTNKHPQSVPNATIDPDFHCQQHLKIEVKLADFPSCDIPRLEKDLHLFRLHVQRKGYIGLFGIEIFERLASNYGVDDHSLNEIGKFVGVHTDIEWINQIVDVIKQHSPHLRKHDQVTSMHHSVLAPFQDPDTRRSSGSSMSSGASSRAGSAFLSFPWVPPPPVCPDIRRCSGSSTSSCAFAGADSILCHYILCPRGQHASINGRSPTSSSCLESFSPASLLPISVSPRADSILESFPYVPPSPLWERL